MSQILAESNHDFIKYCYAAQNHAIMCLLLEDACNVLCVRKFFLIRKNCVWIGIK